jgi:integrase
LTASGRTRRSQLQPSTLGRSRPARYTAGTEFYLATGDIYATQQLLGHADVSTTANIYVQGSLPTSRRSCARSRASSCGQRFRSTPFRPNRSDRKSGR